MAEQPATRFIRHSWCLPALLFMCLACVPDAKLARPSATGGAGGNALTPNGGGGGAGGASGGLGGEGGASLRVVEVTAGYAHSCARLSNGELRCWGENGYGQIGNPTVGNQSPAAMPVYNITAEVGERALQVTAGYTHSCARIEKDNTVACWGADGQGQVTGAVGGANYDAPERLNNGLGNPVKNIKLLARGVAAHNCALTQAASDNVHCWGENNQYQLGIGTMAGPVVGGNQVALLGGTGIGIGVGRYHSCALLSSSAGPNTMRCWGMNSMGQLGDSTDEGRSYPTVVSSLGDAEPRAIGLGGYHTCAVVAVDDAVMCWGSNDFGQLGDGVGSGNSYVAVVVKDLTGVTAVALGEAHSCALIHDGSVMCWGANDAGQLGNDNLGQNSPIPVAVQELTDATEIAAGSDHNCALRENGAVQCWGANSVGQLGDGHTTDSPIPAAAVDFGL